MVSAKEHNRWLGVKVSERKALLRIGANIRRIRKARGWTLERVEEHGGWKSWQHWHQLEQGKKAMTIITFIRICRALEVTPNELLEGIKF